ncbi:MAG: hypothetical protein JJE08_03485 [Proteiniphilum sp.]|nr:hypothetical protein [Proteiniphilum sp.]
MFTLNRLEIAGLREMSPITQGVQNEEHSMLDVKGSCKMCLSSVANRESVPLHFSNEYNVDKFMVMSDTATRNSILKLRLFSMNLYPKVV